MKHKVKNFYVLFLLFTIKNFIINVTNLNGQEINNKISDTELDHLRNMPLDFSHLTSTDAQKKKSSYQEHLMQSLIISTTESNKNDFANLAHDQSKAMARLKSLNDELNTSFEKNIAEEIQAKIINGGVCAFLLKGSPLNLYLNKTLLDLYWTRRLAIPGDCYEAVSGFILYQQNRSFFDQELFPKEENASYKAAVAQHLFDQISIYLPNPSQTSEKSQTEILKSFFEQNKAVISAYLKKIYIENHYIQFSPNLEVKKLAKHRHHIVITDLQMKDPKNRQILTGYLSDYANHKVTLDVRDAFVKDGTFDLKATDIPYNLVHLIITNSKENVTFIGNDFLNYSSHGSYHDELKLKSLSAAGLINLRHIGDNFLYQAKKLKSFDTMGLTSLTSIGNNFLVEASELEMFNTAGLTNLLAIGDDFLHLTGLKSFDTTGLINLTSIGDNFLTAADKLELFNTFGLRNLKSIGHNFLFFTINLKSIDTSGLVALTSIGDNFLAHSSELVSFDTTELTSLTSIGDRFLDRAENLVSFDTSGLVNVKSIGDYFLANTKKLQSFDLSKFTNLTSIKRHYFFNALNLLKNRKLTDFFLAKIPKEAIIE